MSGMTSDLKKQIMGRVMAIYLARKYGPPTFFGVVLIIGAVSLWRMVSFSNVFSNMPQITDAEASYNFYTSAVLNTETAVQVSLAMVIVAMLGYASFLVRRLKTSRVMFNPR